MATHILLAIDGTDSKKWRDPKGFNSHVNRFYLDFTGTENVTKKFLDGPNLPGTDMASIIDEGMSWVLRAIQERIKEGESIHHIKINLVGHSRGGLAVIAVANGLNKIAIYEAMNGYQNIHNGLLKGLPLSLPVYFMGLYDAVKRAPQIGADTALSNVKKIAHARRLNPPLFRTSRPAFSGMDTTGSLYFDTSHGGVGGDPGLFTSLTSFTNMGKDIYCNALQLVLSEQEWNEIKPSLLHPFALSWIGNESKENRANKIRQYLNASRMADKYVRTEAQLAGVPFKGITPHVPWDTSDVNQVRLGDKLSRALGINN